MSEQAQLHAVEKAIGQAKKTLIEKHLLLAHHLSGCRLPGRQSWAAVHFRSTGIDRCRRDPHGGPAMAGANTQNGPVRHEVPLG